MNSRCTIKLLPRNEVDAFTLDIHNVLSEQNVQHRVWVWSLRRRPPRECVCDAPVPWPRQRVAKGRVFGEAPIHFIATSANFAVTREADVSDPHFANRHVLHTRIVRALYGGHGQIVAKWSLQIRRDSSFIQSTQD